MAQYVRLSARPTLLVRLLREAAVATFWTLVLMRYVVFEFVFSYGVLFGSDPRPDQVESLARLAGGGGAALLLALFVARGSWRVARQGSQHTLLRGIVIGALAVVLLHGAVALWFPPVDPAEVALHLPAALGGGLIGAAYGRRSHALTEAAHRAHLAIARARHPDEVATAIGENLLGGTGVVLLWRVPPDGASDHRSNGESPGPSYELCAAWPVLGSLLWPIGSRLPKETVSELASLRKGWLSSETARRLPGDLRRRLPLGSVYVNALSAGDAPVGLLMVVVPRRARLGAPPFLDVAPLVAQQLTIFRQEELAERSGIRGERERLADEIHDTVIQGCIAVGNRIEDVRGVERLEAEDRKELELALKISRDTVEEARLFVRALNTDDFSKELPRLLVAEAEDFRDESGILVRAATGGDPFPLPPNVGIALFKAAREGLANVRKHAGASAVDLVLVYGPDRVSLEVRDDGVGLEGTVRSRASSGTADPCLAAGGHGLKAMRRLVRNAGGSLYLGDSPGGGTTLSVRFRVGAASPMAPAVDGSR